MSQEKRDRGQSRRATRCSTYQDINLPPCPYGISGYDEAKAYLEHPILGARLREITMALLQHRGESAVDILGDIDAVKVRSCMTLFDAVSPDDIFQEVRDDIYGGTYDKKTLDYM